MILIKPCDCDLLDPKCNHKISYDDGLNKFQIVDNTSNAEDVYKYTHCAVKDRWPEAEEIILTDISKICTSEFIMVFGADRETGKDRIVLIQSKDVDEAEIIANDRGILVSHIVNKGKWQKIDAARKGAGGKRSLKTRTAAVRHDKAKSTRPEVLEAEAKLKAIFAFFILPMIIGAIIAIIWLFLTPIFSDIFGAEEDEPLMAIEINSNYSSKVGAWKAAKIFVENHLKFKNFSGPFYGWETFDGNITNISKIERAVNSSYSANGEYRVKGRVNACDPFGNHKEIHFSITIKRKAGDDEYDKWKLVEGPTHKYD